MHDAERYGIINFVAESWKLSTAGRASALQAEGHRFEPYSFHQRKTACTFWSAGGFVVLARMLEKMERHMHIRGAAFAFVVAAAYAGDGRGGFRVCGCCSGRGKTGCPAANFSANHILTFCKRFNETGKVTQFRYFFRFENLEKIFEKPLTNCSEWCIIIYVAERCDAEKKMMEA